MIHCFAVDDVKLALDVYSGALHVLDDVAYAILTGEVEGFSAEELGEARAELDSLAAMGQLFSEPSPDEHEADIAFTRERPQLVKALCLHIAHDCNLRCVYCFAGEGNYGQISRTRMSAKTGKRAIDFLLANSGTRHNLEVDFFGGEPTINFDTVKAIVEYARVEEAKVGKNIRFTLTTNGLLLDDDKINYINRHMDNVVLSLDGRKEVNDRMRKFPGASLACYDAVVPKIKMLIKARRHQNYYIRGTYTRENLDFANDVLHMADLGFEQLSVEPVIAAPDAPYSIRREDIPALCREYERLAIEIDARADSKSNFFNFFHFMLDMENGPCAAKRITGCGAGTEYLAVTPEGDFYPCHQFVGDGEFCLGNLESGLLNKDWQAKFAYCNVHTKPECLDCWAKFFCSGGCAANAYYLNGDIMKPDAIGCELQKKRLECALYLYARKTERGVE